MVGRGATRGVISASTILDTRGRGSSSGSANLAGVQGSRAADIVDIVEAGQAALAILIQGGAGRSALGEGDTVAIADGDGGIAVAGSEASVIEAGGVALAEIRHNLSEEVVDESGSLVSIEILDIKAAGQVSVLNEKSL
jgi:hypothetical protein